MKNDDYWARRIREECCTNNEELNHMFADDLLENLLESMDFYETLKAYRDVSYNIYRIKNIPYNELKTFH